MRLVMDQMAALQVGTAKNQSFSFKRPPILGGAIAADNSEVSDVVVHFSIAGQFHRQVKDLPPGMKIRNVKIR